MTTASRRLIERGWWLVPLLVAALFHARSLHDGFVGDARFLLRDNALLARPPAHGVLRAFASAVSHDYFHDSSGNAIPYYRPLTTGSWLLESQLVAHDRPEFFHAVQISWFVLAVAAVAFLARSLGASRTGSALGATFFAVHPATVEAVSELMARSDVTVTAGVLGALATLHAWMRTGARRYAVLHVLAVVVALASKELSVMLLPVECVWFLAWRTFDRRARDRSLAPLALTALLVALDLAARRLVLGASATSPLDFHAFRWFVSIGLYLRALVAAPGEPATHLVTPGEAHASVTLALDALALAVFTVALAWRINKRDAHGSALLVAALAWLAPVVVVANIRIPGSDEAFPLADRWLVPTIGTLAAVIAAWSSRIVHARARVVLAVAVSAWCLAGFAAGASLQRFYRDESTMLGLADMLYEQEPDAWKTPGETCRAGLRAMILAMQSGRPDGALASYGAMTPACRRDGYVRFDHFAALVAMRRFAEARGAGDVIAHGTLDPQWGATFAQLYGAVLLETGDAHGALGYLRRAALQGAHDCALQLTTARAAYVTGGFVEAATTLEHATQCATTPPPGALWLLAAQAWQRAGEVPRACLAAGRAARDRALESQAGALRTTLGCSR